MSPLLERLRRALAPQFIVEREIAGGGMGLVFQGRDVTLDRPVAIKVLRPEHATAIGVERFLREARLLARLRHPHIVPVYQGGEADGLLYHVLELQEGGTLADRLAQGPLRADELTRLAEGLLGALGAAHAAGVVHRDIKPANIFFDATRVVVADFGIAHTESAEETLTEPGHLIGTRRYMAPEQLRGGTTLPATDVYAAARVLLEAAAGTATDPEAGDARLPRAWRRPLRKALAEEPAARWPDAAAFHAALRRRTAPVAPVALVLLAVAMVAAWLLRPPPPPEIYTIALQRFDPGPATPIPVADSLHALLLAGLTGLPDIRVTAAPARGASLLVTGAVRNRRDRMEVVLEVRRAGGERISVAPREVERADPAAGIDSLVHDILVEAWRSSEQAALLPLAALPNGTRAMALFLQADRLYAAGRWQEALDTYEGVERLDSSCALCGYRIRDLFRWLNRERDPDRLDRLNRVADRFPASYRELIEASVLPAAARLDRLDALRPTRRQFFDFQYLLGDELMHRGPLHGRARREAIDPLEEARRLRPDFAGILEHLLWLRTAEGDSAQAAELLGALRAGEEPRDAYTLGLRALHELGFAWRFASPESALEVTRRVLADPAIQSAEYLPAGPRVMPAFGAPVGAVWFGRVLAADQGQPRLVRAGLLAQALGWVALGRPDSAFRAAADLARSDADADWQLVLPALRAWHVLLGEVPRDPGLVRQLEALAASRQARGEPATRAAWWLAMLAGEAAPARDLPPALAALVRAEALARSGRPADALAVLDRTEETEYRVVAPFAVSLMRLRRAEWLAAVGRDADALTELLWHQHTDLPEIPSLSPQSGEMDWAAATLATWRRAGILARQGATTSELCGHWAEVVRRWSRGAALAAARADTARRALAANRQCGIVR